MSLSRSYRTPLVVVAILVAAAVAAVVAVVMTSGDEPQIVPPSEEESEPEPEPEPDPVAGHVEVELEGLAHTAETRLFGETRPESESVPVDDEAVSAFAEAVAAWLDRHFTELQEGGPGGVVDAEVQGATDTIDLHVSPEHWVDAARYHVVVYARGAPEWARVGVNLTHQDGSRARANLVFLPGEPPRLIAAQALGDPPPDDEAERDPEARADEANGEREGDDG